MAVPSSDDATSQLFFSSGGGGDLSWPAAAEMESKLTTQESLVDLCDKYGVPREFKPVHADTLRCRVCETPPQGSNVLCVHSDALEAGLRFPLHDFYVKLLRHYRLAPSQIAPNAWKYMAGFVLRCKDAGVEPLVSAFRYFFNLYAQDNGWHHFQPRAGHPCLFSGTLPTKYDWKARFFFLESPEGMPWKCPVAWGIPRRAEARTLELTDAAIDKLKRMPCIDLRYYLSLHDPPVGALTTLGLGVLQLQSTPPVPMPKLKYAAPEHEALEAAGASAVGEGDTAGEGDDSTARKRRCPTPSLAAVTPPSVTISATPLSLQAGMESTRGTSFDGASGSSEISLPPSGIWTVNADSMTPMQDEQRDKKITQLQFMLQESEAMNDRFVEYLHKKNVGNDLLKEKHARLIEEHAAEVTKLQEEHVSAVAKLTMHLNNKHAASIARLNEEHAAKLALVKDAAEKKVQDAMKNIVRMLYPEADLSQLEGSKLKGDRAAAGTHKAC